MSGRIIVKDVETLDALLPTWYGRDFAFDIETTGLNYRTDRILGLALTFTPDETSYYIVLAHTEEVSEIVTKTRIEDRPTEAFETVETVTKSGQVRHKKVPITEKVEVEYEEEVKTYPLKEYISLTDFRQRIAGLFAQPDVVMAAHNFKFEKHFFNRLGVQFPGKVVDTQIAAQLVDENRDKGLKDLAPLVGMTDHVAYKQLAQYPGFGKDAFLAVPLDLGAEYAMKDTESTWRLWEKFRTELAEEGVAEVFTDLAMPLLAVLQEMEAQGINLDIEMVQQVRDECVAQQGEFYDRLWNAGIDMIAKRYRPDTIPSNYLRTLTPEEKETYTKGDKFIQVKGRRLPIVYPTERSDPRTIEFNPGSNPQLAELLYQHMKLQPPDDVRLTKNLDGSYKVDKDTLFVLRWSLGDAAPQALQDIERLRKLDKFVGTYLDTFVREADPDNHWSIHTSFSQTKADTGRLSSYDPAIQNLPAHSDLGQKCRDMVIAKPGHSLICCDFSQLELRILAHYSQDEALLTAFANGEDLHIKTGAAFAGISYDELSARVEAGDATAKKQRSVGKQGNFCVPLNTLCLTRSGWKRFDEIEVDVDQTIGYNPETRKSEWTTIRAVNVFEEGELVALSHDRWSVTTTPEHRWYGDRRCGNENNRRFVEQFFTTADIPVDSRIFVAAPLADGGDSIATPQEAALIAWLWTDGHIKRSKVTGRTSQGKDGRRAWFEAEIYQKKFDHHEYLESFVLSGVPHSTYQRADGNKVWHVDPQFMRDLWAKLRMDEVTPEQFVLSLSAEARAAFLDAVERADGYTGTKNGRKGRFIAQETGIPHAVRLLIYMAGHRPVGHANGKHKFGLPTITGQRLKRTPVGKAPVWCPTTDLGTWTLKQGEEIALSGNSLQYGMGPPKYQRYLLVNSNTYITLQEAKAQIAAFNELYKGSTEWKKRIHAEAHKFGYVRTISGRKRRLPNLRSQDKWEVLEAERQAVNAIIQGSAADIIAKAMIQIQPAIRAFGASILIQVHDELVLTAPTEYAPIVAEIVQTLMVGDANRYLTCPLVAEPGIGQTWRAAK